MTLLKRKNGQPANRPVLRALTEQGETYDDPSEDLLFMLFEDLDQERAFFIVERSSDPTGQTYVQVMRIATGYLVERRNGSEATHQHAFSGDMRVAHRDVTTWAFEISRTDALPWADGYPSA